MSAAPDWPSITHWLRRRIPPEAARWFDRLRNDRNARAGELQSFLRQTMRPDHFAEFESVIGEWVARRGRAQGAVDDESWKKWIL